MKRSSVYRFPETRHVQELSPGRRISLVEEELLEAQRAFWDEDPDGVIDGLWLVIQAAESVLRGFSPLSVIRGFARAKVKSLKRGDYEAGR